MRKPNVYAFGGLDRAAHLRLLPDWYERHVMLETTRIVPLFQDRNLVAGVGVPPENPWDLLPGDPEAILLTPEEAEHLLPHAADPVLLGTMNGTAYIALDLSGLEKEHAEAAVERHGVFRDLRRFGPNLPAFEGSVLAYARGLAYWHRRHRFCGICGSPTESRRGGHQRTCLNPDCGAPHFPRTDPAVIMLIEHGDRLLLGRQQTWPEGQYSVLAGFVEPGESLEEAVIREVFEESGVRVGQVRYHSSQPWPFPCSIMLGFWGVAETTEIVRKDDELADARWVSLADLRRVDEIGLRLPRRDSIARRMIEDWMADRG
ncbi:MAG: NAD(+) diphosphatase [Alphaproteobacteria bacterium]|nr:NAD(+) diphosphatase [Alphaproteobacteria bacterium]